MEASARKMRVEATRVRATYAEGKRKKGGLGMEDMDAVRQTTLVDEDMGSRRIRRHVWGQHICGSSMGGDNR